LSMLKYFFYCLLWSLALLIPVAAFITIPAIVRHISNTNYHQSGHNILHSAEINGGFSTTQRNIVILCHNISLDVASGIFDVNNLLKGRIDVLARCVASALWVSNKIRTDTTFYCMLFPHNLTIEIQGSCVQSLTPDERTMALYLHRTLWSDGGKERDSKRQREVEEEEQCADSSSLESLNKTPQRRTYINPQSTPMSNEKRIRDKRKGRDAMLHRIHIAHRGKSPLPGFILHHNDTLKSRLNKLESMWSSKDDDDGRHVIYMLSENGHPLWNVLEEDTMQQQNMSNRGTNINNNNSHHRRRTTTLILGNQLGYSVDDERFLLGEPTVREVSLGPLSLLASQCITITHHYLDRFDDVITKRDTEI